MRLLDYGVGSMEYLIAGHSELMNRRQPGFFIGFSNIIFYKRKSHWKGGVLNSLEIVRTVNEGEATQEDGET